MKPHSRCPPSPGGEGSPAPLLSGFALPELRPCPSRAQTGLPRGLGSPRAPSLRRLGRPAASAPPRHPSATPEGWQVADGFKQGNFCYWASTNICFSVHWGEGGRAEESSCWGPRTSTGEECQKNARFMCFPCCIYWASALLLANSNPKAPRQKPREAEPGGRGKACTPRQPGPGGNR